MDMRPEWRFYRAAIWLPVVLPACIWATAQALGMPAWDPLDDMATLLIISLLAGGIPYAALAAWATWRSRVLEVRALRQLALKMPLLMVGAFLPYALIVGAFDGGEWWWGALAFFGIGVLYILPLGYLYVAVVLLLGRAIRARGQGTVTTEAPAG